MSNAVGTALAGIGRVVEQQMESFEDDFDDDVFVDEDGLLVFADGTPLTEDEAEEFEESLEDAEDYRAYRPRMARRAPRAYPRNRFTRKGAQKKGLATIAILGGFLMVTTILGIVGYGFIQSKGLLKKIPGGSKKV